MVAWRDTQSYEDADSAPWENVKIAQFHFVLLNSVRGCSHCWFTFHMIGITWSKISFKETFAVLAWNAQIEFGEIYYQFMTLNKI